MDEPWGRTIPWPTRRCITKTILKTLLRGARVIRTHDGSKNPHIPHFFHTILGPDYYVVRSSSSGGSSSSNCSSSSINSIGGDSNHTMIGCIVVPQSGASLVSSTIVDQKYATVPLSRHASAVRRK